VDITVLLVFLLVYLAMILGRIPGLALDRTGAALLGAIALLATGKVTLEAAWRSVDTPTIGLLFALMVISAQFRMSGFYSMVIARVGSLPLSPPALMGALVMTAGLLAALLANDIVCFAAAPVLAEVCGRRGLNPVPYLVALACAANVGSAATLIGNPQNMLIGQVLGTSFSGYLALAAVPSIVGLFLVWGIVVLVSRVSLEAEPADHGTGAPPFDLWQTCKGLAVLAAMVVFFLFLPWPRETVALAAAGILLCSRRMRSSEILALVDWPLLVLFCSLFVLNGAMMDAGLTGQLMAALGEAGIDISRPAWLFGASAILSNIVSNVPAVMLLLPGATHPLSGGVLALSSTLAGNLLIVGSIANIIVIDRASRLGIHIGWRAHARLGIPVTMATLLVAGLWLWFLAVLT
jgi:Na+/H+ antiporter NhaD/arsenite permease-like protein